MSLGKALRLSELHKDDEMEDTCLCHHCTMEGCVSYSEKIPTSVGLLAGVSKTPSRSRMACSHRSKKERLVSPSSHSLFKSHFWKPEEDGDEKCCSPSGSIYRRPIQVTPRSMMEGHNMGSTLFLIIVFNLALAHHGTLASASCGSEDERRAKLKTTLKLYELAELMHQRHKKRRCIHRSSSSNNNQMGQQPHKDHADLFGMIVCNNSIHIHRSLNDNAKHQDSLQRLTSALMLVVDHKKSAVQQLQQEDDKDSSERHDNHIEEFLRTACQLILRKGCADPA